MILKIFWYLEIPNGVKLDVNTDDTYIFLPLLILLYANDTMIFSVDKNNLQYSLNVFEDYCEN